MQLLYDNLVALIIGGVIMVLMATMALRNVEPKAESYRYYNTRVQMNTLTETIRKDMTNLGAGTAPGEPMLFAPQSTPGGITTEFRFRTGVGDELGAAPINVAYELAEVAGGCRSGEGAVVACYRFRRALCDDAYTTCDAGGEGPSSVTMFAVDLLNAEGVPTNDPDAARGVRVRLAAVSPDGGAALVPQVRWESSFRPLNLERQAAGAGAADESDRTLRR